MIIYRLAGRAGLFNNCGMNLIAPRVSSNLTAFRKEVNNYRKCLERDKTPYRVSLTKLTLRDPKKEDIACMFGEYEDPWHLVTHIAVLNNWEYEP